MKQCYSIPLLLLIWIVTGCQSPQLDNSVSETPIEELKVTDLKDNTESIPEQHLMTFRVLTYTIVPGLVDELQEVFDELSENDVRMVSQKAFRANGFAVGTAHYEQAPQIAKKLNYMGAVRTAQVQMIFPPDSQETLSYNYLQPTEVIHYAKSANTTITIEQEQGFLGWVLSARPDKRFRGMALVKLFPAFWQPGNEQIRLVLGKEPFDYHPIQAGQVLARIGEGGIILLGPIREVPEEATLDKKLFFIPGQSPKIRFFVIICDSVGT